MIIPTNETTIPNQVSFSPTDSHVVVVTGKNTYRYYREQENHMMKVVHTGIQKKDLTVSTNYTCHSILPDGKILLCTD